MSPLEQANSGLVSAIVCTRNRGASVVRAVQSILASDYPRFELIVIDQSSDEKTKEALAAFHSDSRFQVVHSNTVGVCRARNIGLRAAAGDVCCFTDDDCAVSSNWIRVMAAFVRDNPRMAIAFCDVIPGPYDPEAGFIPVYTCAGSQIFAEVRDKRRTRGIGAGFAVRASALAELGGFDELLGPGAPFPACEDGDVAVRSLLKGYCVGETGDTSVTHYGFRTWAQGRELARRDWVGVGAAYVKPLKCGRWDFLPVVAHEVWTWALWPPLASLLQLKKPQGISRLISFLRGASQGWRTPVDPGTVTFVKSVGRENS